jgi:hypothetical protein
MKLLAMYLSPASHHFVPLRLKYSLKHPVLKHPEPMFFRQRERPGFSGIQNKKNCDWVYILSVTFLDTRNEDKRF